MTYPELRRVVLRWPDIRGMTILEQARACALANVGAAEADAIVRGVMQRTLPAAELERGTTLLYAIGYQLEKRLDPSLTWEAMQAGVDLKLDLEDPDAQLAEAAELEAEARAVVGVAVATGLPPREAAALTMREIEAYRDLAASSSEGGR